MLLNGIILVSFQNLPYDNIADQFGVQCNMNA